MASTGSKVFLSTIRGKVIAIFILSCVTISTALYITYHSFQGLLTTVDTLTLPRNKINLLNSLYRQITQLDQLQRAEVLTNPNKSYSALLKESQSIILTIDTLKALPWQDKAQLERLTEMENILVKRDKVLLSYLKIKSEQFDNQNFLQRFDSLADILAVHQMRLDTSFTTTEHHTSVSTADEEDKKSLISRLFTKKKAELPKETRIEILKELKVTIDSSALAEQDSTIAEISKIMSGLEESQRRQSRQIQHRELNLIQANNKLIKQLITTLHEVEKEENLQEEMKNNQAFDLVNKSILRIGFVILIFLVGTAVLFGFILADVKRSIRLRKELIKAKEMAEQSEKVKQRFLANMSHEIRTPLQSIIGYSEQLKDTHGDESDGISAIHHASEHLLHIVNEILDISKIESGKLVIHREVFNLRQTLHEIESSIRVQAQSKGLELRFSIESVPDTHVVGDAFRLKQVLFNLLGNAIKFTANGYVELVSSIAIKGYMAACTFEIKDTGIGMEPAELKRIFEQFEQAKSSTSKDYGGTGLGLTIVKKLVEVQNGKLSVESTPGKGSTFKVELEYDMAPHDKVATKTAMASAREPVQGKVLVVDDDPMILKLCGLILSKHNVEHQLFSESEKALNTPLNDDIQLILLDIRMPRISGIELCQEFKSRSKRNIRVIALTAHVLPQEKASLLKHGFDHVLTKPFRESDLLEQLGIDSTSPQYNEDDRDEDETELLLLSKMTLGDKVLFKELVHELIADTGNDINQLEEDLHQLDKKKIREHIHKLAGRTGQVGAGKIAKRLRSIEEDLELEKPFPAVAERIISCIDLLRKWLINLESIHDSQPVSRSEK